MSSLYQFGSVAVFSQYHYLAGQYQPGAQLFVDGNPVPNVNGYWSSVASNPDGTVMLASDYTEVNGNIWISTDQGTHWNPSNVPIGGWYQVAVSGNGTTGVAVGSQGVYLAKNNDFNDFKIDLAYTHTNRNLQQAFFSQVLVYTTQINYRNDSISLSVLFQL
jgi:hypothetical protein